EKGRINEWLAKDPERRVFLNQLEQIWQSSAENKQDWDVEASWNRFKEEYGPPEHDNFLLKKKDTKRRMIQNYNQKRRRGRRVAYSVAACIVVLLAALFYFSSGIEQEKKAPEITMQKIITQKGERTKLKLSDGSKIVLNADSKLRIPSNYGQNIRRIYLEGEAYFEVEHNEKIPFTVQVGHS